MNVLPLNIYKPYTPLNQSKPTFLGNRDKVYINSIEKKNNDFVEVGRFKPIRYKNPVSVAKVFTDTANNQEPTMFAKFVYYLHYPEEIKEVSSLLVENPEIGNIKVKSLIGLGNFAYVFETEDGLALKISQGPHFPDNRPPADFDFPIIKSGKIAKDNIYYYFIEEIARQDNLKDSEIIDLIKYIKSQGYSVVDCYTHCFSSRILNRKQFGIASDGKVYLLDPGCAIRNPVNKISRLFLNLMKKCKFK